MFYEDFNVGDEFTTEAILFSAEHIIAFAQLYDPQPFHTDIAKAETSIYGGLIASGWHVFSAAFGATVRLGLFEEGGQGTGRLEDVYWSRPVRAGDSIRCVVSVLDKRESRTRPDRGYIHMQFTMINQQGQTVAGFHCDEIILKQP